MPVFDCSITKGNPTGRVMEPGFPEPAQKEVIAAVVEEKIAQIKRGELVKPIALWTPSDPDHPEYRRVFIMDGQHRFVAACILGTSIEVTYKKFGIPGFLLGWVSTQNVDIKPAKEVLREQIAKVQAVWPSSKSEVKNIIIDKNIQSISKLV